MNIIASNRPFPNRDVENPTELTNCLGIEYGGLVLDRILFPFWSWRVTKEITDRYTCIGFHTGPVNGGSPIQNLIRQGVEHTDIRVFKLNDEIDGGIVLDRLPICIVGNLEEIIIRISDKINDYIQKNYR